jgi:hypothetical protein
MCSCRAAVLLGKLERQPAREQRHYCQDDQDCHDPEEQPRGAIHIQPVISGVE